MAYAVSTDGVRIAYEIIGHGPPLLLLHAFTGSGADWREFSYVAALERGFQLILMDGRGHGRSDKPHDPASYAIAQRVADLVAILDVVGIEKVHYCGYSMGGRLGFGLGVFAPERVASLVLGGSHPYQESIEDAEATIAELRPGIESFVGLWEQGDGPLPEPLRSRLLANDADALIAERMARIADGTLEWGFSRMTMPCLVYAGDTDEPTCTLARRAAADLPRAEFVALPDSDHLTGYLESAKMLPHVRSFLARVS
jgi:pimeloyl-ACP methyl ester carboxylesterase